MTNVNKAFTLSNDGLLIERTDGTDGVWYGGGDEIPTHQATIGSMYIRTNGDWFKQEGPGTTDWVVFSVSADGVAYSKQMGKNGNSGVGKWLDFHHNISSKDVPFSVPEAIQLTKISADIKLSSTVTFTIFKNGSPLETLTITSDTSNEKIGLTHSIIVGDSLSVKVTSGTSFSPTFHLFFG